MDIFIYILIIVLIVIGFVCLKWSQSPFLFIGLIVLSCLGLILSVSSDAYITTGYTTTVTSSNPDTYTTTITPIKDELGVWQYIFHLQFLAGIICAVVFWSIDE
jgi:drug/metabolite transporter (DMT)-like permease